MADLSPEDASLLHAYRARIDARKRAIATACVHSGEPRDPHTGALDVPITMSSAFAFDSAEQAAAAFRGDDPHLIYGRWGNPTVRALEEKMAALEGAEAAAATASGMAAVAGTILATCKAGDHVVAPRSMYAESARLLRERLPPLGITTTFVDATAPGAYEEAVRPETRVIYLETPANPTLAITDLVPVVALARARGIVTVADNTFATPFSQTPHALGVDLVVHSMTKGISGHGDVVGGIVTGKGAHVTRVRDVAVKGLGGVISPHSAWLVARGLRTLALRQAEAALTAAEIALRLSRHPAIERVHHPFLPSHPGHEIASRQMHAFGAVLAFEVRRPNALARGRCVLEAVKIATHAVSLGDARTLLVHPASTTHSTMPKEARAAAGVTDGLLRMSVGLESSGDLWDDLHRALVAAVAAP